MATRFRRRAFLGLAVITAPSLAPDDRPGGRRSGGGRQGHRHGAGPAHPADSGPAGHGCGSVTFVVSLPFTVSSGSVGDTACELVKSPLTYTFTRPLGELEGQADPCRADQGKPSGR